MANRYIDVDALLRQVGIEFCTTNYFDHILKVINEQPEADAVEVVRCKDCMWGHEHRSGKYYICPLLNACFEQDDFFCAFGERRDYGKVCER